MKMLKWIKLYRDTDSGPITLSEEEFISTRRTCAECGKRRMSRMYLDIEDIRFSFCKPCTHKILGLDRAE